MSITVLETIITSLIRDGSLGDVSFSSLETDETEIGAQFSSYLTFVSLTLDGPKGKEVLPLVVKLPTADLQVRRIRNSDAMFNNEVAMYKEILPELGIGTSFIPRILYGSATNGAEPDNDILVFENLKYKNFLVSKTGLFLDIDHLSIAIKKVAEFHSFSFILKHNNSESFLRLTKKLRSIDLPPKTENELEVINAACVERGFKPLLKNNISVDLLTTCLKYLKYPHKAKSMISSPEGPFAVICHGDLCNNNILYKFDENDKPKDCIFFDFQYALYGSPAVDLFFFLYLNTTSELRNKYWDMILKLYWDTLRNSVPKEIGIPSFEDFLRHFAERAMYGYIITSFFLPVMMENEQYHGNETKHIPLEEKVAKVSSIGGEKGERAISEIVSHLLDKGYINAFIELCKNKGI